jgi:hypothetical protein
MADERTLTEAERSLVAAMFGDAVDPDEVRLKHWPWWPLQPRSVVMAPMGHLHFHPGGKSWCGCFGSASIRKQAFFLHEMTHVWQSQTKGRWYLPLMRHPFCAYDYVWKPGKAFADYGIEQQAEIVAHVHLMRNGVKVPGKPPLAELEAILPFHPAEIL